MNNQEIFNKVCQHLAKQKRRAYDTKARRCMYRMGGLACAIGCLIPDHLYSMNMEGHDIIHLDLEEFGLGEISMVMLRCLQVAHDESHNLSDLKHRLWETALTLGLDGSSIDAIDMIEEWSGKSSL